MSGMTHKKGATNVFFVIQLYSFYSLLTLMQPFNTFTHISSATAEYNSTHHICVLVLNYFKCNNQPCDQLKLYTVQSYVYYTYKHIYTVQSNVVNY